MSTTDFFDKAHSVAELVFHGADVFEPEDKLDAGMLEALGHWRDRSDRTEPATEMLQLDDCLGFVISYRGESTEHWPSDEATILSEALIRDFLFDDGICNFDSETDRLYSVRFQMMASRDSEHLLVCPYVTEAGNIAGLIVVCVNKRLK